MAILRAKRAGKDPHELMLQREALKVNNAMPAREIPRIIVGTSDFKKLVLESDVVVDKSLLVKAIFESPAEVLLITRPRRWGKSLNLRMLKCFFEIETDDRGQALDLEERSNTRIFVGLAISKDQKIMKELGQYPVILFSLKNTKGNNYREIVNNINKKIQETYRLHAYLSYSERLGSFNKKKFQDYCQGKFNLADLQSGLYFLSELLAKHFKKQVFVLVDEYDETINASYTKLGYGTKGFEQVLDIIREMLSAVLKDNPYLKKGVLTGILRIAKANLFSGLNNVEEYTLLNPEFGEFYGFTQKEQSVYNPYSLMSHLSRQDGIKQHWTESGNMDLLEKALLNDEIQEQIQQLVNGEIIVSPIEEQISFGDFEQPETLFSLLLFSGYLNPVTRFSQTDTSNFLPEKKIPEFVKQLREFLLEASSFLQTGKKQAESFYNGFVLSLIHILRPIYLITSEQESGKGRIDLTLIPKSIRYNHAFILEYKVCNEEKELELTAEKGLNQIKDKKYNLKVWEHPKVQEIYNLSLAFCGKEMRSRCEVERKTSEGN
ncbi:21727_t:CDS:2 [Gigaspora margarita]|uniref:21727_t:CDS:1 n=1 Tax=Gigaspora margarita TaxID=4874 RepID=A0ABM8VVD3_GIGMA|nr:21727_t:CDS:2 [Gigaspora margarita]